MPDPQPSNAVEWTVGELSRALKRTLEDAYGFVRVRGEISGYRGPHASGHVYFCLKDTDARIDAIIWRHAFQRMRFRPEEGMEVIATGKITTYPGKSTYQITIETLEPAGVGALLAQLEERRKRLAAEGLFDAARKQLLPFLPEVIGVVTSPTGAVIRDILHRLADRFPRRVLVWPVRVQGETSAAEVAAAIDGFNALPEGGPIPKPDLIIVARGGGSLEDLWGFNEEIVVRAVAAGFIPLISAVGHETDTTLIDFVADKRAPTPTAAAEMAVPVRSDLIGSVGDFDRRLLGALLRRLEQARSELRSAARALPGAEDLVALPRQRLDLAGGRLLHALSCNTQVHRAGWTAACQRLARLSPEHRVASARARLEVNGERLERGLRLLAERRHRDLDGLSRRFSAATRAVARQLAERHERASIRLVELNDRRMRALRALLAARTGQIRALDQLLTSYSYRGVLDRGFALVRGPGDLPLRSAAAATPGLPVTIEFADGKAAATIEGAPRRAGARPKPAVPAGQSSLFGDSED
jgi:exodeoxyribonuclease VII large subunit